MSARASQLAPLQAYQSAATLDVVLLVVLLVAAHSASSQGKLAATAETDALAPLVTVLAMVQDLSVRKVLRATETVHVHHVTVLALQAEIGVVLHAAAHGSNNDTLRFMSFIFTQRSIN